MAVRLSRRDFEQLVQQAIDSLPDEFQRFVRNTAVVVEDRPSPAVLSHFESDMPPEELLGFYDGVPITEQGIEQMSGPHYIYLFQRNIEAICETDDDIIDEVHITLLHEVGHHFGLDEDDLERLGYA